MERLGRVMLIFRTRREQKRPESAIGRESGFVRYKMWREARIGWQVLRLAGKEMPPAAGRKSKELTFGAVAKRPRHLSWGSASGCGGGRATRNAANREGQSATLALRTSTPAGCKSRSRPASPVGQPDSPAGTNWFSIAVSSASQLPASGLNIADDRCIAAFRRHRRQ